MDRHKCFVCIVVRHILFHFLHNKWFKEGAIQLPLGESCWLLPTPTPPEYMVVGTLALNTPHTWHSNLTISCHPMNKSQIIYFILFIVVQIKMIVHLFHLWKKEKLLKLYPVSSRYRYPFTANPVRTTAFNYNAISLPLLYQ